MSLLKRDYDLRRGLRKVSERAGAPAGGDGQREYRYEIPIEVRFRDLDAMQHVNNAVYVTYFEHGRAAFFRDHFGVKAVSDIDFIVARVEVDYRRPILLTDEVRLQLRVGDVGRTSFAVEYRLLASGEVAAEGRSVQVFYDYEKKAKKPVPPGFAERVRRAAGGSGPC
jgi:acyl-CoA thioester hydrolase